MGRLRHVVKRLLFGSAGARVYRIRLGLNRGSRFEIDPTTKAMRLLGLDERELEGTIRAFTARARVAIDVGANDGWYALFFATRPHIEATYVFEPCSPLMERARRAFELNGVPSGRLSLHSTFVGSTTKEGWCRLDDVLSGRSGPFVIKVDVEGGEADVLCGAERLLRTNDCWLVIETHGGEIEAECLELLRRWDYETRVIDSAWYRRLLPEERTIAHNRWIASWPARAHGVHGRRPLRQFLRFG